MHKVPDIGHTVIMKRNFFLCGLTGWCLEILFTSFDSFRKRELQLMGKTSLWMFPIYGMTAFFRPFCRLLKRFSPVLRGAFYSCLIFLGEYVSGSILKKYRMCPWDYSQARFNIGGVIRLDYAPVWFLTGLLYEKMFKRI